MKVEIWSDIMCPFCYIGKRRFEKALSEFPHRDKIEVEWKSFQLNPGLNAPAGQNIHEYLSETKGWTLDYARQVNNQVARMAREEGLTYDFDKAIVANSFDAHRLIQLAKSQGKGDMMEEIFFKAYFTEGRDIADPATLLELGMAAGLDKDSINNMLDGNGYADAVEHDIYESQQIGVRGVPYFVFNDKYAVYGAQASETFLGALNKSWSEWDSDNETINATSEGKTCEPGGDCL